MPFINDDISINTFLGAGSMITGDLNIAGFTRIDGDVDGNIETNGKIIIGEKARIRGNVSAKSAIIGGIIEGNITAPERVQVFETAAVIGDITTQRLELADNVIFHGHCIALSARASYDQAVKQWNDTTTIRASSFLQQTGADG